MTKASSPLGVVCVFRSSTVHTHVTVFLTLLKAVTRVGSLGVSSSQRGPLAQRESEKIITAPYVSLPAAEKRRVLPIVALHLALRAPSRPFVLLGEAQIFARFVTMGKGRRRVTCCMCASPP